MVHPQQPVNASVFAAIGCRPLIPETFPQRNFRFLYSSHSGVTCHPTADAKQRALSSERFRGSERGSGRSFEGKRVTFPSGMVAALC